MRDNFMMKNCTCGWNNPTCPECNDMGGFNLNDDYKRQIISKSFSKVTTTKNLNNMLQLIQKTFEDEYLFDKRYERILNHLTKKKQAKSLLRIIDSRLQFWKLFHKEDFDKKRRIAIKIHIDYLTSINHQLQKYIAKFRN